MTDSPPARNLDLLERTMAYIEAHPEQHDQSYWVAECGTAFCFAGHAALLSGASLPGADVHVWYVDTQTKQSINRRAFEPVAPSHVLVCDFAARNLGLSEVEADRLFDGVNTAEDLRRMVELLKDGGSFDRDANTGDIVVLPDGTRQDFDLWLGRDDDQA